MKLHLEEELRFNLSHIIDDELVVEKTGVGDICGGDELVGSPCRLDVFSSAGGCPADALGGVLPWGKITRVVISTKLLVHIAESHFTQQH